jgi:peptidoglycan/LPS O-acetylase OafA/YrhL
LLVTGTASWFVNGAIIAIVGISTALVIQFVHLRSSRLTDFGLISYSLYLLHVPIGGKIMNLGGRFAHTLPALILVLAAAVVGSVAAAALFYRFIELPSQRLSSSVRYSSDREEPAPAVLATATGQAD